MSVKPDPQLTQLLQQQLKDVHSPEAIGWWPLAISWWVLLILVIVLISLAGRYLLKKHLQNRYRKAALDELSHSFDQWKSDSNNAEYLQRGHAIIKRVFLHLENSRPNHVGKGVSAGLSGDIWAEKINSVVSKPLSDHTINALVILSYQAEPKADIELIQVELRDWLINHRFEQLQRKNKVEGVQHA